MACVWVQHGSEPEFLVALVGDKLHLRSLAEQLQLHPGSLRVGSFALSCDESGMSRLDLPSITSFAAMADGGQGTKSSPFVIHGRQSGIVVLPHTSNLPLVRAHPDKVPFSDVKLDFELPFKGRDGVMLEVVAAIDSNFTTFASCGISREQLLFIALEGLAGVGKTRFMLETKNGVGRLLQNRTTLLAELHRSGSTAIVYMTFNGSSVGHSEPHFLNPDIIRLCQVKGSYYAGRDFFRVSVVSQVLYGRPWGTLEPALRKEVLDADNSTCVQMIADHVKEGLGISKDRMAVVYLLVDESQQLGRAVSEAKCAGTEFLRGMFSWLMTVVTSIAQDSIAKSCKIGFITLLAGTVLPVGGKYGVSDWMTTSIRLEPLEVEQALEVLSTSVRDNRFGQLENDVRVLVESDCGCLPRLIRFVCSGWKQAQALQLPAENVVAHLRASVMRDLKSWADTIVEHQNREQVKRMVRLCLTEMVMPEPVIGRITSDDEACFYEYVYTKNVPGGVVYKSPMLVIHAVGLRLHMPTRMLTLSPQPAEGDVLEYAFLDMLHARLSLMNGQTRSLEDIFPGAFGHDQLLKTEVKVPVGVDEVVNEKYQFYNPNKKRFYNLGDKWMVGENGRMYMHPNHPGVVFKTKTGTTCADGRLFLIGASDNVVYEFWLQLKGENTRLALNEADSWAEAAFSPQLEVHGRKKVYVLCSRRGFSFHGPCNVEGVLLVDLGTFMPSFLRRCTC